MIPLNVLRSYSPHPDKLDLTGLTQDEITHGIKSSKLPDYIRYKQYFTDTNEALAQLAEMIIQFAVNLGLDPDQTLDWARKLQQVVPQSEFDSWIATLLDGGPSIFMNTLSELQAKYPNGAAGVALVRETDPSKIYVWNGTTWEDFGDYQGIELKNEVVTTPKIANSAVTASKTDFLELDTSVNLFDGHYESLYIAGDTANGFTLEKMNGNVAIIPVKPNTRYSIDMDISNTTKLAVKYGFTTRLLKPREPITAKNDSVYSQYPIVIDESPSDAKFLYISTTLANTPGVFLKVVESDVKIPITKGEGYPIKPVGIDVYSKGETVSLASDGSILKTGSVDLTSLKLEKSRNIFNKDDKVSGFYINRNNGTLVANSENDTSNFINIESPETMLAIGFEGKQNLNIAFYKSPNESTFLSASQTTEPLTISKPDQAKWIRVSKPKIEFDSIVIEHGTSITSDGAYFAYPKGLVLPISKPSTQKRIKIKSMPGKIIFYLPVSGGYTEYAFEYSNRDFSGGTYENDDLWRLCEAFTCDDSFMRTRTYSVLTRGEIECAIKIKDAQDFIGGVHGYEHLNLVHILVDGVQRNLDEVWELEADNIEFVQKSNLIKQATSNEVVAEHLKHYKINSLGITIDQKVIWNVAVEIDSAYLGMLPIRRTHNSTDTGTQVTNRFMATDDYLINDVSQTGHSFANRRQADEATVWGTQSKVSGKMMVNNENDYKEMFCQNTQDYNKLYFAYVPNGHITDDGETWTNRIKFCITHS